MNVLKKEEKLLQKVLAAKTPVAFARLLGAPDIVFYSPDSYDHPAAECEIQKREINFYPDEVHSYNNVFNHVRLELFIKNGVIVNKFLVPIRKVEHCTGGLNNAPPVKAKKKPMPAKKKAALKKPAPKKPAPKKAKKSAKKNSRNRRK